MNIVGINLFHADSAACVVVDGKLIAAAEEERFRRIKHWAGFPSEAIRYCLREAGLRLKDVDHLAVNSNNRAHLARKFLYALLRRPDPAAVLARLRTRRKRALLERFLAEQFGKDEFRGTTHRIEHHIAHLFSAFHTSPFEEALAVSIDAMGDFASTAWGMGRGTGLSVDGRVFFPHSLGIFYTAMTQYLGFPHYGDEYKVMGLAPYGRPTFVAELGKLVRLKDDGAFELDLTYFRHHSESATQQWIEGQPLAEDQFAASLESLLGPRRLPHQALDQRHFDLAFATQAVFEQAFFHLLAKLHERYGTDDIVLAGGCVMNSVANGKIRRQTPFKRVYLPASAGDAGGAIGAALAAWNRVGGGRQPAMMRADWGPGYSREEIAAVLDRSEPALREQDSGRLIFEVEDELCRHVATAIAEGKVVGWFQGRMEWGPRALGNRSILADPRRPEMKAILNAKIKRRESFRPFAPSVLREHVADWFEEEDDVPFMMQVFQVRPGRRATIPAVTHIDGSGRLQTVDRKLNPRYWRLIETFRAMTGVPMILNTSFNENEPVVCRPEEALACFFRTDMDLLVLGQEVVARRRTRA